MAFPGAWLQLHDIQVHLLQVSATEDLGAAPRSADPRANHVAFSVANLDEFRRLLRSEGVESFDGPDPNVRQIILQDPSGNVIEFTPNQRS
jgi:catechol 2,3-dioxygenase-like lactoylglutathione lyase family enzyme